MTTVKLNNIQAYGPGRGKYINDYPIFLKGRMDQSSFNEIMQKIDNIIDGFDKAREDKIDKQYQGKCCGGFLKSIHAWSHYGVMFELKTIIK